MATKKMNPLELMMAHSVRNREISEAEVDCGTVQEARECISTGSVIIDHMIGGKILDNGDLLCPGIPKGVMTEVFGPEGSGKTTLALETAANVLADGGSVLYLDYEDKIDPSYALNLGVDIANDSQFDLVCPAHFEEGALLIRRAINAGVDLIVVDSIAAIVPKKALEASMEYDMMRGIMARKLSKFFPMLLKDLKRSGTALLFTNQVFIRSQNNPYDSSPYSINSYGGRALKYYMSLRIELERQFVEDGVESEGIKVTLERNKIAPSEGYQATVPIRFGEGFDNIQSILDIGLSLGLVRKEDSCFVFTSRGGTVIRESEKGDFRKAFLTDSRAFADLKLQVEATTPGYLTKVKDSFED